MEEDAENEKSLMKPRFEPCAFQAQKPKPLATTLHSPRRGLKKEGEGQEVVPVMWLGHLLTVTFSKDN